MRRSALQTAADRLGYLAYLAVMGGGRPDWQLFLRTPAPTDLPTWDLSHGMPSTHDDPFSDTVPLEMRQHQDRIATN